MSIDTLDPAEIKAAVEAGAELVLSADAGNIEEIAPYVSNVAVLLFQLISAKATSPKKPKTASNSSKK